MPPKGVRGRKKAAVSAENSKVIDNADISNENGNTKPLDSTFTKFDGASDIQDDKEQVDVLKKGKIFSEDEISETKENGSEPSTSEADAVHAGEDTTESAAKVPAKRGRKKAAPKGLVRKASKEESGQEDETDKIEKESDHEANNRETAESDEKAPPAKRGRKAAPKTRKPSRDESHDDGETVKVDEKIKSARNKRAVSEEKPTKVPIPAKRGQRKNTADALTKETEPIETTSERPTRGRRPVKKESSIEPEPSTSTGRGAKRKMAASKPVSSKRGKASSDEEAELRDLSIVIERDEEIDKKAVEEKKTTTTMKGRGKKAVKDDSEPEDVMKKPAKIPKATAGSKAAKKPTQDVSSFDFNNESTTPDGKKWNFKVSVWNIGGVRAWLQKNGLDYIHRENPDVFCLQETKCSESKLPQEMKEVENYHRYWLSAEKEGYSGVAVYSKTEPSSVSYGIGKEEHDKDGRVITAEFEHFYLVNAYVPNAGRGLVRLDGRMKWDVDFREYLMCLDKTKPVVVCGDLNVAHAEADLANPKANRKNAGFTKEERDGFSALLEDGNFVDTFRHLYPDAKGAYTFWTYLANARAKNVGWRLDYFVVSKRMMDCVCDNVIRKDVLGSDHCPLTLFLKV